MDCESNLVAREKEIRLKVDLGKEIEHSSELEVQMAIKKAEDYKNWKSRVLSEKKEAPSKKVCLKQSSIKDMFKKRKWWICLCNMWLK